MLDREQSPQKKPTVCKRMSRVTRASRRAADNRTHWLVREKYPVGDGEIEVTRDQQAIELAPPHHGPGDFHDGHRLPCEVGEQPPLPLDEEVRQFLDCEQGVLGPHEADNVTGDAPVPHDRQHACRPFLERPFPGHRHELGAHGFGREAELHRG